MGRECCAAKEKESSQKSVASLGGDAVCINYIYSGSKRSEGTCGVTGQVLAAYRPITSNDSVGSLVWECGKDEETPDRAYQSHSGLFSYAGDNDVPQPFPVVDRLSGHHNP